MVVYQFNTSDILARLSELTLAHESAQDDKMRGSTLELLRQYFHAFEHLSYCIQTNGILLDDDDPDTRSRNDQQLRSFFSLLFDRETKARLECVLTTLKNFRVSSQNKTNNPCILLDRKSILSYFYSSSEKRRQQETVSSHLTKRDALDNFVEKFILYSKSCIICEPNLGEWLGDKKSNWKISGFALFIKTLLHFGNNLEDIILVTKKKYAADAIKLGVSSSLEKCIGGTKRVPIFRIKQLERPFLGHDRFFVNDFFFCSFGKGFELYSSDGKFLPDLNIYWGGPKSKCYDIWESIEDQEAIATF